MINLIIGRFKIIQHNDKKAITITNLVETKYIKNYILPIEIAEEQGS